MLDLQAAEPILLPLLEWMQDANWPVFRPMSEVLPRFHAGLTPVIKRLLQPEETDDIWKLWIIRHLLDKWPEGSLAELLPEIERIAVHPTASEHLEETDEAAQDFLAERATSPH
jgi:hypothetical protein